MADAFECDIRPGETVRLTATGEVFTVSEVAARVNANAPQSCAVADASGRWYASQDVQRAAARTIAAKAEPVANDGANVGN